MENRTIITVDIDRDFLDKAEEEACECLYKQRCAYNERWYKGKFFRPVILFLRMAGLLASASGLILSIFYLLYPSSCPGWFYAGPFLAFFTATLVLFYYLSAIEKKYINWLKGMGRGSCLKMAKRLFNKARMTLPFTASYTIEGKMITYIREKGGEAEFIWKRGLKGFVFVGNNIALLFRKKDSFIPIMVILYKDKSCFQALLTQLGFSYELMHAEIEK